MANILVVEDDRSMRLLTSARLSDTYNVICACNGSRELLQYLWLNLLSDAIKYTPSGGEITLTLRDEFEGLTNPITSVMLSGTSLTATYSPNAETKWSGHSTAADDEVIKTCPSVAYDKDTRTATYEVILLPQTVAANTFCVTIFIGDKSYEWTSSSEVTLASSNKYTLALKVGKDKVSGNSFTAAPWASGGEDINNKTE